MAKLFGWEITKPEVNNPPESPIPKVNDDGALVLETGLAVGGAYGIYYSSGDIFGNEGQLINKYRELSLMPDVDYAIDEIINEMCSLNEEKVIELDVEDLIFSKSIKDKLVDEFEKVQILLDFKNNAYDVLKRWYIDGRIHYHVMIDEENTRAGIQELRYIDPRKIRKIKELKKVQAKDNVEVVLPVIKNTYYLYSDMGFVGSEKSNLSFDNPASDAKSVIIAEDSIVEAVSGLMDIDNRMVLSFLHKAIRPFNQLHQLESAAVIYRVTRAPERRIFYIDVGNLPKAKAEQYLQDMMTKHRNKLVYDSETGKVKDDRKTLTMLEDFWLPRRDGKGTEIDTLDGGTQLGEMGDIDYFRKAFYRSLNLPISRLDPESGLSLARATEISRDEVKFTKFINRLRRKFSELLLDILHKQLILKNIIKEEDWHLIKNDIQVKFSGDNMFEEIKENEIFMNRLDIIDRADNFVGRFFSNEWLKKNILKQTDKDIDEMNKEIKSEKASDEIQDDEQDVDVGQQQFNPKN